ncbi:hypothetical protein MTBSS4_280052 [Magnetospirillum sp. SS-4]|nr:hypothetical protein MTBSS4_280052 [Magnetospirillum sp. SS-4]
MPAQRHKKRIYPAAPDSGHGPKVPITCG